MSEKDSPAIGKVPTLLELARTLKNRPKPPTLLEPSSDDSDLDQPPVATKKSETKKLTVSAQPRRPTTQPSPNTRRRSFCLNKNGEKFDQSRESERSEGIHQTEESTNLLVRSSTSKSLTSGMEAAKRYVTFRAREDSKLRLPKIRLPFSSNNYQIKEVRRGIPKIVRPNQHPAAGNNVRDLEATAYFVCQPKSKQRKNPLAWVFSFITVSLCLVFPLASFGADIAFFIECSDHYNETMKLLDLAKEQVQLHSATTYANDADDVTVTETQLIEAIREIPAPLSSNNKSLANQSINTLAHLKEVNHQNFTNYTVATPIQRLFAELKGKMRLNFERTPTTSSPFLSHHAGHKDVIDAVISAHCYAQLQVPVCSTVPNVLIYMTSKEAAKKLQEHRRVTSDVFEPVFILGTFPCLILSMFTRLVVMTTSHDHFVSAYVMNMLCMPLQLVTGALAVHSASYHVGQYGFECWKCAIEGNCTNINALSFMKDHLTDNLIVTTIAKFLDGVAGGCVLFVVLSRKIWVREGHVSFWWYACRLWISIAALVFCVIVCSTMVLTPSLGVFRLEMMEKTAYFQGKNIFCYGSMVLLAMGLTAWGASLSILFLFLCFKTYVYCRRKELINGEYVH